MNQSRRLSSSLLTLPKCPSFVNLLVRRNKGTGILLLNMGGPKDGAEVGPFLKRLFTDRDIMQLPAQDYLGSWIAKRRTPSITEKYNEIGGGSPIYKWTDTQGRLMCEKLDILSPSTAPHKHYVGFRYATPLTEEALDQMERDGIERGVAFSQYPQYSCATTGSSIHAFHKYYMNRTSKIKWSLIDRWGTNRELVKTIAERVRDKLFEFDPKIQSKVIILFSAHSLPLKNVNRGDPYPVEVSATVQLVMEELKFCNPYRLVWQSKVGFLPWLRPSTDEAMKALSKKGMKNLILVPVAFVNEHIETLHELDIEYGKELADEVGVTVKRADAPNDHGLFIKGLASIVADHLNSGINVSPQVMMTCPLCTRETCRNTKKWLSSLNN